MNATIENLTILEKGTIGQRNLGIATALPLAARGRAESCDRLSLIARESRPISRGDFAEARGECCGWAR